LDVYVGGSFGKAYSGAGATDAVGVNCVAVWRNDARRWEPLGDATVNGTSSTVYALAGTTVKCISAAVSGR
jgi:hypothetical protein